VSHKVIAKNKSSGSLHMNPNDTKGTTITDQLASSKQPKTLLQSHSYADFKAKIGKKKLQAAFGYDSKNSGSNVSPPKDRSLIIKSIYESNTLKDHMHF
jgi:hypothetical protein